MRLACSSLDLRPPRVRARGGGRQPNWPRELPESAKCHPPGLRRCTTGFGIVHRTHLKESPVRRSRTPALSLAARHIGTAVVTEPATAGAEPQAVSRPKTGAIHG